MKRRARAARRGFTLVELMISLVLFLVAIAGTLDIAVTMSQAYRDQRQVILTESSVRAPMDFIADAIRNASPAVGTGNIQEVLSSGCNIGAITEIDNTTAPDELYLTYASGGVVTSLRSTYDSSTNTSITVTDASQINPGDYLLLTDTNQGTVVQVDSSPSAVDTTTGTISLVAPACAPTLPSGGYVPTNLVIRVKRARFYVDVVGSVTDGVPTLMMDPDADGPAPAEPLAENIEDMQVALGVDVNANKGIDTDEWAYSSGTGALAGSIRAVRVTLIARAANQLIPLTATYQRPNTEDRTDVAPLDTYRRRVLTSTVEVRNLAGSP